jgi:hypothetical protein
MAEFCGLQSVDTSSKSICLAGFIQVSDDFFPVYTNGTFPAFLFADSNSTTDGWMVPPFGVCRSVPC